MEMWNTLVYHGKMWNMESIFIYFSFIKTLGYSKLTMGWSWNRKAKSETWVLSFIMLRIFLSEWRWYFIKSGFFISIYHFSSAFTCGLHQRIKMWELLYKKMWQKRKIHDKVEFKSYFWNLFPRNMFRKSVFYKAMFDSHNNQKKNVQEITVIKCKGRET